MFLVSGTARGNNEVCMQNLEAVHCIRQGWGKRGSRRHLGLVHGLPVASLLGIHWKSCSFHAGWCGATVCSCVRRLNQGRALALGCLAQPLFSTQDAFSDLALFFYDKHGGEVIAVLWKPLSFQPQPFKVSS